MSWKIPPALLCAVAVLASAASAVVPTDDLAYEVRLPLSQISPTFQQPSEAAAASLLPSLSTFRSGEGAGWRLLQWNDQLGAPAALAGPAIPLVGAGASREMTQMGVEAFLARNQSVVKADLRDLRVSDVADVGNDKSIAIFDQYWNGLPVVGGRVDVTLWEGKVVLVSSNFYPNVRVNTFPSLDADAAVAAAHIGIPSAEGDAATEEPHLAILPLHQDAGIEYHLAWYVPLKTNDPDGLWDTYVDAQDGTVLWRQSAYSYFEITGHVAGMVEENWGWQQFNGRDELLRVTSGSYNTYTDVNGDYSLTVPNNQQYPVNAQLFGNYCNVNNQGGSDATITQNGFPGTPLDFNFTDANSHIAERDAYYHVNVVHDWIKSVYPGLTGMDFVVPANVNINQYCNAFWNGSSVNFYREGGGCNNTGRISEVIYHEYGHGITQKIYYPSQPPTSSGMGEAFSDITAICIHPDPKMGEFFYTNGAPVRDGENLRQYPGTECGGQVHCLGEILMGSMWKTRKNFHLKYTFGGAGEVYDPLYINTVRQKPTSMPSFLTKLLTTDDNDGNLNNGTPNWYEICDAFAQHNLPCPALTNYVTVTSVPLDDQPQESGDYPVTATAVAVGGGAIDPSKVEIYFSTDGENYQASPMSPTGNPDEYAGVIPYQGCAKIISYYVRAEKFTGENATAPFLAPYRAVYRFLAGPTLVTMSDDFEADSGWTITGNATAGAFERADPEGKYSATYGYTQPEDDHSANGVNCFVTDPRGGVWSVFDVDGGATGINSPVFDWSDRSGAGVIGFWGFFFDYTPTDDSLRVMVSNNGGQNYTTIRKINGNDLNDWLYYKTYFTSDQIPFTDQMVVRIQMEDINGATSCAEAAIDDIEFKVTNCVTVDVAEDASAPAVFTVDPNRPNPFNPRTTIRFGLPSAGDVRVEVFDASGRLVRTLVDGQQSAGFHSVVWDGKDDANRSVGSGVYYYKVQAGEKQTSRKMLLLK
ncbi:MAG: FlgD immunoglobulin-like domain containing protein [Candidatus Eisenbacteria bacterium]